MMVATLRRYLVAGLLIWVPLGVTLLIIKFLVDLMDQTLLLLPQGWQPEQVPVTAQGELDPQRFTFFLSFGRASISC